VAPGGIAAVRAPGGSLTLGRIYYERTGGGREYVRLLGFAPGALEECHPLSDVVIEGAVICACPADT